MASTWNGRNSISTTRGVNESGEQPTNAAAYVGALGDKAGSGEALESSAGLVGRAYEVSHPPGSWRAGMFQPRDVPSFPDPVALKSKLAENFGGRSYISQEDGSLQHSVEEAGMSMTPRPGNGRGLFGR